MALASLSSVAELKPEPAGTNQVLVKLSTMLVELPTEATPDVLASIPVDGGSLHSGDGLATGAPVDWEQAREALSTRRNADVLSCPVVLTRDGETATITIGREIAVPRPAGPEGAEPSANNEPEFVMEQVGVFITVTPQVSDDGTSISLDLDASIREALEGQAASGNGNTLPTVMIQSQDIRSTVQVRDGAAVLLGGLTTEETIDVEDRVPILGSLPLLGSLFTRETRETRSVTLYLLAKAEIVDEEGR